jgi:hypothetical protein
LNAAILDFAGKLWNNTVAETLLKVTLTTITLNPNFKKNEGYIQHKN